MKRRSTTTPTWVLAAVLITAIASFAWVKRRAVSIGYALWKEERSAHKTMTPEPGRNTHPKLKASLTVIAGSIVVIRLTNIGDSPASVLRWNVPKLGHLDNSVFVITNGDSKAAYKGFCCKRPAPEPSDYETLEPGATLTHTVDLSSWYDVGWLGPHRAWYEAFHGEPDDPTKLYQVVSNEVEL